MTLYIRDRKNDTVAEVEYYKKGEYLEISAGVDIETYSMTLLDIIPFGMEHTVKYITDFQAIQELRGWLHERVQNITIDQYDIVLKQLRDFLQDVAKRYNMHYVED